jgi:hypothetical protein
VGGRISRIEVRYGAAHHAWKADRPRITFQPRPLTRASINGSPTSPSMDSATPSESARVQPEGAFFYAALSRR